MIVSFTDQQLEESWWLMYSHDAAEQYQIDCLDAALSFWLTFNEEATHEISKVDRKKNTITIRKIKRAVR